MANRRTHSWRRRVGPLLSVVTLLLAPAATSALAQTIPGDHTSSRSGGGFSNVLHASGMSSPFANNCTDCHGPFLGGGIARSCFECHWDYNNLNGGNAHPKDWTIPSFNRPNTPAHDSSKGGYWHSENKDLPYTDHCTDCHGPALYGGLGPSCYQCHDDKWDPGGSSSPPVSTNPPLAHDILKDDGAFSGWHKSGFGTPYVPEPTASDYACSDCHGPNLDDGFAPSCYTCHPRIWAGEGPPLDHDVPKGPVPNMHQPGLEDPMANGCTQCHGSNLGGDFAPSCNTCHVADAPHDFTGQPWLNPADTACTPCHDWSQTWNHTPSPTSNYTVTATTLAGEILNSGVPGPIGQPTGSSSKCLDCHEGNITVDDFTGTLGGTPGAFIDGAGGSFGNLEPFGIDLTQHHPVSFTFDTTLSIAHVALNDPATTSSGLPAGGTIDTDMLDGGLVQCTTCHIQHDNTFGKFLVQPTYEELCFTCHTRTLPQGTFGTHHIPLREDAWHRGQCTLCHGANLDGVGGAGPACEKCHPPFTYPQIPTAPEHHGNNRYDPLNECALCHGETLQGAPYGNMIAPSCYSCHDDVWVGANLPPVPDAGGPYVAAFGEAVQFDASGSTDPDGDSLSYAWDFGDDSPPLPFSPSPTATHIYGQIGTYTAELSVTDGYTNPVVALLTVEITDVPLPPGDTWIVHTTTSPPETFAITIEDHVGTLVVLKDDGVNSPTVAIGIEMAGVIFWMDIWMDLSVNAMWGTGNIYFGNINRQAGTMLGVVFDDSGGVATFAGTKSP